MRYEILKKEEVFKDFFQIDLVELRHERFHAPEWSHVKRYNLKRPAAAAILIENIDNDAVVLTEQFRYSSLIKTSKNGWSLEVPAGLTETGETPEACAIREALEETGYRLSKLKHLTTYFSSVGLSNELIYLYHAQVRESDKAEEGGGVWEENEDIKVTEIPFADAFSMIAKGNISDGKTIIALQWLALQRLESRHLSREAR